MAKKNLSFFRDIYLYLSAPILYWATSGKNVLYFDCVIVIWVLNPVQELCPLKNSHMNLFSSRPSKVNVTLPEQFVFNLRAWTLYSSVLLLNNNLEFRLSCDQSFFWHKLGLVDLSKSPNSLVSMGKTGKNFWKIWL